MYCCELCNNNVNNNFEIKKPKQKKTSHHNLTTKINTGHILTTDENITNLFISFFPFNILKYFYN